MNAPVRIPAARPVALRTAFAAWRIAANKAYKLTAAGETLAEVLASVASFCVHKDHLAILEADSLTGAATARFYVIKRKSQGKRVFDGHVPRVQHDLYAEHLFDVPVARFDPVEPWRWSPGADVVGVELAVVA